MLCLVCREKSRQSAGVSYRAPLHADLFFKDQLSVDEFLDKNSSDTTKSRVSAILVVYVKKFFNISFYHRRAMTFLLGVLY